MIREYECALRISTDIRETDRQLGWRMDKVLQKWEWMFKRMRKPPKRIQRRILQATSEAIPKNLPIPKKLIIQSFGYA